MEIYLISASHLEGVNKLCRDRSKRLFWPWEEPVNGGAVDETGELLCPASKGAAHRAEAQNHVQPVPHAPNKEGVQIIIRVRCGCGHTCVFQQL